LLRGVLHDAEAFEDVVQIIGIRRLRRDLRRSDAERGGIAADVVFEGYQLRREGVVVALNEVSFGHDVFFRSVFVVFSEYCGFQT
jgi:hypothetical protein